ncbi:hypothetical protein L6452_21930 [Arctium lappa]|uniref:Uncharacterized protein n=1 Tax=Arctium lappa TaxID=4217 RepID=A0ACB9AXJ0_ARCLA|nr:hypothetical protein L6452_21930 [Arctium lappa]
MPNFRYSKSLKISSCILLKNCLERFVIYDSMKLRTGDGPRGGHLDRTREDQRSDIDVSRPDRLGPNFL